MQVCISCGREFKAAGVSFPCPGCKEVLTRCNDCKEKSNKYSCKECGFTGP